jgi:hypothetical protein
VKESDYKKVSGWDEANVMYKPWSEVKVLQDKVREEMEEKKREESRDKSKLLLQRLLHRKRGGSRVEDDLTNEDYKPPIRVDSSTDVEHADEGVDATILD